MPDSRSDDPLNAPLSELVLSPRWVLSNVPLDGARHTVFRIWHPRFGPLDFLLQGNDCLELGAGLAEMSDRRDAAQLGGAQPSASDREAPDSASHSSLWSKIIRSQH